MNDIVEQIQASDASSTAVPGTPAGAPITPLSKTTKSTLVIKLLSRSKGATLAEIMKATGWQPHSSRAYLTGLRRKGMTLLKEARRDGETCYRIER